MPRSPHRFTGSLVRNAVEAGKITQDDADLIAEYIAEQEDQSPETRYNTFYTLVVFRELIGEYRKNSDQDLSEGIMKFKGSGRSPDTVARYLAILRQFYRWLAEKGYSPIAGEVLGHKMKNPDRMEAGPESVLTGEEISRLIEACRNSRDRALVALLCDTGIKTKEACRLTWGQCVFDEKGLSLAPGGHTKFTRNIPCDNAVDYLIAWRDACPGSDEGDNRVFVTRTGSPLTYESAFRLLGKIVRESGIRKPVHLHLMLPGRKRPLGEGGDTGRKGIKKTLWRID